jgi:hypothetical protein
LGEKKLTLECVGCHSTENLTTYDGKDESYTICKTCDTILDDRIKTEKTETKDMAQIEEPKDFSDVEAQTVFVIGSPTEIEAKVVESKSKLKDINVKIDRIEKACKTAQKYITFHKDKLKYNLKKLEVEEVKSKYLKGIEDSSGLIAKFKTAELFGKSADGELRVKIDGKWFNENLQEFVKVQEEKMPRKMEKKN